jgi:hypothetical protein
MSNVAAAAARIIADRSLRWFDADEKDIERVRMEFPSIEYERNPGGGHDKHPWMQKPGKRRHRKIVVRQ